MLASLNGVSASVIVSAINQGSNVSISANEIDINGVVNKMRTYQLTVDSLVSGGTSSLGSLNISSNFSFHSLNVSWKTATISGKTINYLGR